MADFTRLNKYRAELKKMKDKRAEMDGKIRDLNMGDTLKVDVENGMLVVE